MLKIGGLPLWNVYIVSAFFSDYCLPNWRCGFWSALVRTCIELQSIATILVSITSYSLSLLLLSHFTLTLIRLCKLSKLCSFFIICCHAFGSPISYLSPGFLIKVGFLLVVSIYSSPLSEAVSIILSGVVLCSIKEGLIYPFSARCSKTRLLYGACPLRMRSLNCRLLTFVRNA